MVTEKVKLNNDELRNKTCNLDGDPKVGWLRNKNGLLLKTYGWLVNNAIGNILLIHGYKAHTRLIFMKTNLKTPINNENLVINSNNCYIYKDSWIEKFNQCGYSVYGIDLQGHGESQALNNLRGDINCFDDIVDDVIQYMYQIQDNTSNDNQKGDKYHNTVKNKKKKLPMYIIGHSMGGNIALRILQLLGEEKEYRIKAQSSNNYKNYNIMLNNSTNINENANGVVKDMINDKYNMSNGNLFTNSNGYGSYNSYASTSTKTNSIASDKDEGCYNYLDNLNIKCCISLSGMIRLKTTWNAGNISFKYLYLPIINFLSLAAPEKRISSSGYKKSDHVTNIYKHDILRIDSGAKFKCLYELVKATTTLNCNINYMPKDIPLLFVHSIDDNVCCYNGSLLFYDKVNVNKKELHIVNGMNHAITLEPGNEYILKLVIDWICNLRTNDEDE
ncbi:lysophospholipase, putative [Plasmodium vinckei vinckei]|uniref:Lysophospholipase, putative n=1 Tax=Plasmodium vinckei vinckei TaxID=54757 RepID=A0A449BS03_PLAVN|nr:lysophospholipase, putative [Plasmodium vinckei vinckei]VEV56183.1 lysophospholipase, putative [Plasmodium vinckei vinckei]